MLWIQTQLGGWRTLYKAEQILGTDSLPVEHAHGWQKALVDSSGDHGMQAFLPWPELMHHRA